MFLNIPQSNHLTHPTTKPTMPPFRSTLFWAAIAIMVATHNSPSLAQQWTPPQNGLIAVGYKDAARAASRADSVVGRSITINQPSPSSAFWALWSESKNSVSFNMPPYGLSGHSVVSGNQQADPVSWNVRPMLDAHCSASWSGFGYINGGNLTSESDFHYSCVPAKGVTRKIAWIKLTIHGSPNVYMGDGPVIRVDLGDGGRGSFVQVIATSPSPGTPSKFVISTFFPTSKVGTQSLATYETMVSSAPMDTVNHLLMIEFPESSKFSGGSIHSKISGDFNRLPTGSIGSGMKFLNADTWLMWDDAPRTSKVVTISQLPKLP